MILVEHGPEGKPALFAAPLAVISAYSASEVAGALAQAEAARAAGAWVAGYIAYEAGYALEPKLGALMPEVAPGPLVLLGVFERPLAADAALAQAAEEGLATSISAPEPVVLEADYATAAGRVFDYIAAGDCYQVNLTFPLRAELLEGTPLGLYGAFRRTGAVGHGAYVDLGQGPVIVSRSPELFFRTEAGGRIETRPMKGTRPRGADAAADAALIADLAGSVKDRAENLMIVDLLRNDISRLAKVGSVRVPALYAIESYATVHQMTSTVVAELEAPATLPGLMEALFPCGSVTGAPKIRAMEIIRELEPHPRGIYCGAVGWMGPDGASDFSVAIRTLAVSGSEIVLNVGGALTHGSTVAGEWEEALWKARFVNSAVRRG
ncbi:aminodeoxychorismate synthase component I [Xinfangfangia sp. CPCC 101601]|uniref:Aminodeoxychorismate synthase component I n=1 Tax=Pseudogemmobacter lacusdianii TaxID=3069608 RepID=A0ABU0VSU4_9RHOB|nr:aminodeoxychorismate synthase component I [Xinfangfangia sp. CPCC 101601]MDQ2064799.1 aminodeoxychorismate synthase component I [Xinfangfangia sp. CPCC 101601]